MQFERVRTGKIAALTALGLATLALTYEVQGCAVDGESQQSAQAKPGKTFAGMPQVGRAEYIYEKGDPVDQALVDVNGRGCNLFTDNVDVLVALREHIAPDDIVYPGVSYRIPVLACASAPDAGVDQ